MLFQIELIIAKILLPKFGGSYTVWGACIVFFQCAVLLGYLYSHFVVRMVGIHKYRYFHLGLIFLPLLFFPGRPLSVINVDASLPLVAEVFLQLLMSIGFVFFILSTLSLISQTWLAASRLPQQKNPYGLYAVSNTGSFFALLSYPFFFEYNLDISGQLVFWRWAYFVLLLVYLTAFIFISTDDFPGEKGGFSLGVLSRQIHFDELFLEKLRWFLFSAAGAIIFLSVTNVIASEIVPCPLIWIIPLSIYLLSFVLTFKANPWGHHWFREKSHFILGFSIVLFFLTKMYILSITVVLAFYFFSLFALCMLCQHELFERRPKDRKGLTSFYVIMSLGGFGGGFFVAWIAPKVFSFSLEYLVGLWMVSLGLSLSFKKEALGPYYIRFIIYLLLIVLLWPLVFHKYSFFGLGVFFGAFYLILSRIKSKPSAVTLALFALLGVAPMTWQMWASGKEVYKFRNYYGIYTLKIDNGTLLLLNGTTLHGRQFLDDANKNTATAYYHLGTPIGKVLSSPDFSFKRIGVVGLGAGTLAAYGKKGQTIDFYELDPDIVAIAGKFFSFLKDSGAKVNCFIGDARVNLTHSHALYDVLIIDAFSGDSVPVHLLTTEAIMEYKKHLVKDGIIFFHISNRYLYLYQVILSNARFMNGHALFAWNKDTGSKIYLPSVWASISWDEDKNKILYSKLGWSMVSLKHGKTVRPWTDNYSCILSILNAEEFIRPLKDFKLFD